MQERKVNPSIMPTLFLTLAAIFLGALVYFNRNSRTEMSEGTSEFQHAESNVPEKSKKAAAPVTKKNPSAPIVSAPSRFELKDAGRFAWFSSDGGISDGLASHFEMAAHERKVIGDAAIAFNKAIAEHIVQNAVREVSSSQSIKVWNVAPFLEVSTRCYEKFEKLVSTTLDVERSTALLALFKPAFVDRGWYEIVMTLNSEVTDGRAFRFENRHPHTGNSISSWPATRENAERRLLFRFDQLPQD